MIGAVIAMDSEAEALLSQMEIEGISSLFGKPVYTGKAFGKDVLLVVCGVGKVNAAAGACAAIQKGADVILIFGVAGGLNDRTEVSELYAIDKAVQYDFDCTQLNGSKVGTLDGETENFMPLTVPEKFDFPRRALGTGDRFNDSVKDHDLLTELGCDIREMEGGAIAEVCKYAGIPFISVKSISDVYGSGSTNDQFRKNLKLAILNIQAHMKEIIEAIDG